MSAPTPTDVLAATGIIGAAGFIYWGVMYFYKRVTGRYNGTSNNSPNDDENDGGGGGSHPPPKKKK
jgi:hypothetical protein